MTERPGMKVVFNCQTPFMLTHGGGQVQIEQTIAGLRRVGVEVEHLRWWDDRQRCDILHLFDRPLISQLERAQQKGIKVVLEQLLTGLGSRPPWILRFQKAAIKLGMRLLPKMISARFSWDAFQRCDACIANTPWEAHLMQYVFGAAPDRVHVLPNGVEDVFRSSTKAERGPWLVCTATITVRKRVLELAEAAVHASTPVWIIGKPYAESDPYFARFLEVARRNPQIVRYEGAITDRSRLAQIYREARGYVLLSTMETRSLSSEEAAACECPLLLSELPWAKSVFGASAWYCPITGSVGRTSRALRQFYEAAPSLPPPPKPVSWLQVGEQLKAIYEKTLRGA